MDVAEELTGDGAAGDEQHEAHDDVAQAPTGDVQHGQRDGRKEQRRAEVLLNPEQDQRCADHDQQGRQVRQRRQIERPDAAASVRE
jgi:hypothetical protein